MTQRAMIVQTPINGATHVMPCVRPYAEANPSPSTARAMPVIRSFPVSVGNRLNPTTHGETAR